MIKGLLSTTKPFADDTSIFSIGFMNGMPFNVDIFKQAPEKVLQGLTFILHIQSNKTKRFIYMRSRSLTEIIKEKIAKASKNIS